MENRSSPDRDPVPTTRPNARPRLLFLSHTLPHPADGGVNIRTHNVLRLLSREFSITALCFYRRSTHPTRERRDASLAALSELADVRAFPIPQEYDSTRLLRDHLRSVVTGRPYTVAAYDSVDYRNALAEALSGDPFDLVHVDSLDLSGYLPLLGDTPVVCVHHNVESQLLRRRADTERNPLLKAYFALQSRFIRADEQRWGRHFALNVHVSEPDSALFQQVVPGAPACVVPNGVDTHKFTPADRGSDGLVFVGGYDWYPNRDALEHFANDVLPHIRRRDPAVKVRWVGRAPDDVRKQYADRHGIELTGYVDDIRATVQAAACFVVPLRVGGGTRLKILDAWALGMPVVSTSVGCEGLDCTDGEDILISDDPEKFARSVLAVLADASLHHRLAAGGRALAERRYDWEIIGVEMIQHYYSVLATGRAQSVV